MQGPVLPKRTKKGSPKKFVSLRFYENLASRLQTAVKHTGLPLTRICYVFIAYALEEWERRAGPEGLGLTKEQQAELPPIEPPSDR